MVKNGRLKMEGGSERLCRWYLTVGSRGIGIIGMLP